MRELEESLASAEKMKAEVADKLAEAEKKAKEGGGATLKPGTVAVSKEAADDAKRELELLAASKSLSDDRVKELDAKLKEQASEQIDSMSLLVQGDRIISHMDKELRNAEVSISDADESNRTGVMMRVATKLSASDKRDEIMQRAGVASSPAPSGAAGAKSRPAAKASTSRQMAPTSKVERTSVLRCAAPRRVATDHPPSSHPWQHTTQPHFTTCPPTHPKVTEANQQFASELAELSGGIGGGMKELQAKLAMKRTFGQGKSGLHAPQGVSLASAAKNSADGHKLEANAPTGKAPLGSTLFVRPQVCGWVGSGSGLG